VKNNEERVK